MAFLDKMKNLLSKNAHRAGPAIDKAGDMVDRKTQGKYAQHVDKVQDAARKHVSKNNPPPPGAPNTPPPPAPPQP